jgi:hypothetical protein
MRLNAGCTYLIKTADISVRIPVDGLFIGGLGGELTFDRFSNYLKLEVGPS